MIKVYAMPGPARSRRVLWALEELGAPYEVVRLKFPARDHHPEYLKINPAGAVPALEDGELRLLESLAICDYVSRKFGGELTVEPDEADHPRYMEMMFFGESTLAPPIFWARRLARHAEILKAEAREAFATRLTVLERALGDGRPFLAAGRLTLADVSVGYVLTLSEVAGLDDLIPPRAAAYHARLKTRPAYQRAYAA